MLYQVVEDGECHVWTECAGTITQQQGCMHGLTNLTTLNNQGCLYALAHADQIMVNSTYSQQ